MVYSISEDKKRHSIKLKSTNEMTLRRSLKLKNIDEISSKDVNLHSDNSKQYTTKSVIINLYIYIPIFLEIMNLNVYQMIHYIYKINYN